MSTETATEKTNQPVTFGEQIFQKINEFPSTGKSYEESRMKKVVWRKSYEEIRNFIADQAMYIANSQTYASLSGMLQLNVTKSDVLFHKTETPDEDFILNQNNEPAFFRTKSDWRIWLAKAQAFLKNSSVPA